MYIQRDFWSKGEATKNFVVLQKTYSFVHDLPEHLISLVLAATSRYGRLIAMTSDGAVLQMGAVQTTIIQHTGIVGMYKSLNDRLGLFYNYDLKIINIFITIQLFAFVYNTLIV